GVSGVVLDPGLNTDTYTATPYRWAAVATLLSVAISPPSGAVAGGTQSEVMRTALIPAAASCAIFCRATTGSLCRTASSAAPKVIVGPALWAAEAPARKSSGTKSGIRRRIVVGLR